MANTTFKGPVTSLNGFIGGPNKNAGDTQQGGKNTYSFASTSTVTDGTNTLDMVRIDHKVRELIAEIKMKEAGLQHIVNKVEDAAPQVSVAT